MKRIASLLLLLLTLVPAAFAATPADSISIYLGRTQGVMLNRRLATMPVADSRFKEGLLKGLQTVLTADTAEIGYTEGLSMGLSMLADLRKFRDLGTDVDTKVLFDQLRAGLLGPRPSDEAIAADNQTLARLLRPMLERAERIEQERKAASTRAFDSICTANLDAGTAFIDSLRKADPAVTVLPSGLAYKVIAKGKGPHPRDDQKVDVIYTGTTIDGREFDSSKGKPVSFQLNGVIRGFAEGLSLMNKGAHWILYIPGELAYGSKGVPGTIEPMQMLVFDVELTDIIKK